MTVKVKGDYIKRKKKARSEQYLTTTIRFSKYRAKRKS